MKFATTARLFGAATVASLLLAPAAQADSGFYIGASVGEGSVDISEVDFEESDTSWKAFGGFIWDMPVVDVAVEAAYVDFGSPSNNLGEVSADGISAMGLAGLDFGLFGMFLKAGYIMWDGDDGVSSDDGTDLGYGVGFRFNFSSVEVRAEYELFEFDAGGTDIDVDMASIGVLWRF